MGAKMFDASLIISFYNNILALESIFRYLESQKINIDIIIADDGSKPEITAQLDAVISASPMSIKRVSQLDIGFRKNRALNKAIASAQSDYLIFIDGDCIPQSFFIADHLKNKEVGVILNGRRADIPMFMKDNLLNSSAPQAYFSENIFSILYAYLLGKGKNIEKGVRIPFNCIIGMLNKKKKGLLGCNFSLYKNDLLAVNGFDNQYEVAGVGEDTDIEYRLTENGIKIKNLFYRATMLHPLHPELPRCDSAYAILAKTKQKKQIVALDGYQQAFDKD
jgi:glycosyltransferase involved in cell wall biosynthesis